MRENFLGLPEIILTLVPEVGTDRQDGAAKPASPRLLVEVAVSGRTAIGRGTPIFTHAFTPLGRAALYLSNLDANMIFFPRVATNPMAAHMAVKQQLKI